MGNEVSTVDPQPGDLIEIPHPGYTHWAVYIGDGLVVHLTAQDRVPSSSSGIFSNIFNSIRNPKAIVMREELQDVAPGNKWKVNNLLDGEYRPRDAKVIVEEALRLVGTEWQDNLLYGNCEQFATELRYKIHQSRQDPQPGDLIEISRPGYEHWAVYIGDGLVVHLTAPDGYGAADISSGIGSGISSGSSSGSFSGSSNTIAIVKMEKLQDVAPGNIWRVNNLLDGQNRHRDVNYIVEVALSLVGTERKYDLMTSNCEHFATELRYVEGKSRQVLYVTIAAAVMSLSLLGPAAGVVVGVGCGLLAFKKIMEK